MALISKMKSRDCQFLVHVALNDIIMDIILDDIILEDILMSRIKCKYWLRDPLHNPVTCCGINYVGMQMMCTVHSHTKSKMYLAVYLMTVRVTSMIIFTGNVHLIAPQIIES